MLRAAARASTRSSSIEEHVVRSLKSPWRDGKDQERLGLAISGGVDSMALATICRRVSPSSRMTAFIVDHALRIDSATEARNVSRELTRLGIDSQILTLDWSTSGGDPRALSNFETVARRLRYQAIGKACYASGIRDLLVAHHADDQAETVMIRMLNGYTGLGLAGVSPVAQVPACGGMYGVDGSGRPVMRVIRGGMGSVKPDSDFLAEAGGVTVHRPLLPFAKDELIAVCEEAGTTWFEDPSNAVPQLTLRNAVRHLLGTDVLPAALRKERLLAVADAAQTKKKEIEDRAKMLFAEMQMTLDVRLGTLAFDMDVQSFTTGSATEDEEYHIRASLLRRLLTLVSPVSNISLQELDVAVNYVFPGTAPPNNTITKPANTVGVRIQRSPQTDDNPNKQTFLVHRIPPPKSNPADLDLGLPTSSRGGKHSNYLYANPEWHLFDSRYWFRISQPGLAKPNPRSRIIIRFLTPDDIGVLKKRTNPRQRHVLQKRLRGISPDLRKVIPVVVFVLPDQEQLILGLPTLNWRNPGIEYNFWQWEVRYKDVEFEETGFHRLVSS